MFELFKNIDTQIFLFFNGTHFQFLDSFYCLFTERFVWIPLYVALFICFLKGFGFKKGLVLVIFLGLSILFTDQVCASLIRPFVERMRPSNLDNPLSALAIVVDDYRGGDYGFPSCHSANSFALATFIFLSFGNKGISWCVIVWALINSYTRLYLGVHYPGDLLVGAMVGISFAIIMKWLANKLFNISDSDKRRAATLISDALWDSPLVSKKISSIVTAQNIFYCVLSLTVLSMAVKAL